MKPNLFIVGAPKCGTTAWVEYLRTHADIYFSPIKEPSYFCTDFARWRSITSEQDYFALFDGARAESVVGEASVHYLYSTEAAAKIRAFNPDARIIIFVRGQEDFLPSWHNQMLLREQEVIHDFAEAWRLSGSRTADSLSDFCKEAAFTDYKAIGMFAKQIERYQFHFPQEQIRVFHFDDWSKDPRATYIEIMRFLGLKDDHRTDFPRINEARHRRAKWLANIVMYPPPALRRVRRLLKISGRNLRPLARVLMRIATRRGYQNTITEELRENIRIFYENENALLDRYIWRPTLVREASDTGRRPTRR